MRTVKRSALVAQSPERMYALINDVERYPEFLPWCTDAKLLWSKERELSATIGVKRGPLRAHFTTRNEMEPGRTIRMRLVDGPFSELDGLWTLTPIGDAGARIDFTMTFAFANPLTAAIFEPLFETTAASLVDAFVTRAKTTAA